jgi:hypothetical protein
MHTCVILRSGYANTDVLTNCSRSMSDSSYWLKIRVALLWLTFRLICGWLKGRIKGRVVTFFHFEKKLKETWRCLWERWRQVWHISLVMGNNWKKFPNETRNLSSTWKLLKYMAYCKIWGFHGGDYEESRLLGYKNPVRTSQETYYVSATESNRLMLRKTWGFQAGRYEKCRLLIARWRWDQTAMSVLSPAMNGSIFSPFQISYGPHIISLKIDRWWTWRLDSGVAFSGFHVELYVAHKSGVWVDRYWRINCEKNARTLWFYVWQSFSPGRKALYRTQKWVKTTC